MNELERFAFWLEGYFDNLPDISITPALATIRLRLSRAVEDHKTASEYLYLEDKIALLIKQREEYFKSKGKEK